MNLKNDNNLNYLVSIFHSSRQIITSKSRKYLQKHIFFLLILTLFISSCSSDSDSNDNSNSNDWTLASDTTKLHSYKVKDITITDPFPFVLQDASNNTYNITASFLDTYILNNFQEYFGLDWPSERDAKNGIKIYQIRYTTQDFAGNSVLASGLVIVPLNPGNSTYPLLSLQHGTMTRHADAPSVQGLSEGFAEATQGYVTAIPDYLGFGESSDTVHPYIIADVSGIVVADMIIAAQELAGKLGISLNGKLFLKGYSEGGYVTMAAQKVIENNSAYSGLNITGSAPGAGPYDLESIAEEIIAPSATTTYPAFVVYLIYSYVNSYADIFSVNWSDYFSDNIAANVVSWFDGTMTITQINKAINPDYDTVATNISDILSSDLIDNYSGSQLEGWIASNTLLNWTPKSPMTLYHCQDDDIVDPSNTDSAYNYFEGLVPDLIDIETATGSHTDCSLYFTALDWFDTLN